MHLFICDDEESDLKALETCIMNWAEEHGRQSAVTVHSFHSSEELLSAWDRGMRPDMLFLDIQIPGEMNGIQAARQIFSMDEYIPIVFLTHYAEYACEGYKVNALRYLRKPVKQEEIFECMDIGWRRWLLLQDQAVVIETSSQTLRLPVGMIICIEVIRHQLNIMTADEIGSYGIHYSLKMLKSQLPDSLLVQCHRSYLVNIRYVRQFRNGMITLSTGKQIPIGRNYSKAFVDFFKRYYGVGRP